MRLVISVGIFICCLFSARGDSLYSTVLEQQDTKRRLENLEQVFPKRVVETRSDSAKMEIAYYELDEKPKQVYVPMPKLDPPGIGCPFKPTLVVIEALVDTTGNVVEAKIFKPSGNEVIDRACLDASRKAKFTPARHKGKSVYVWIKIPYRFRLADALE